MQRRTFLATLSGLAALNAVPVRSAIGELRVKSTSNTPPRKVIVGTAMQSFWGQYPGLRARLDQLTGMVDEMAGQARTKYGRRLDLAVLPETAITGEAGQDAVATSVPLAGQVQEVFSRKAREHGCYIVVPTYLLEAGEKKACSNAAVLIGRKGEVVDYYEDEDCGIFWSNDPGMTIGQMVRSIGVLELEDEMARVRKFYRQAGVPSI